jgi:serine/threonine protein kinase
MEVDYTSLVLIGSGSFGCVYKGTHRKTGDIVALKQITKIGRAEKEVDAIRKEFKIQRKLRHRNIVAMLDAFENESEIIAVTEYVPHELHHLFGKHKEAEEENEKKNRSREGGFGRI